MNDYHVLNEKIVQKLLTLIQNMMQEARLTKGYEPSKEIVMEFMNVISIYDEHLRALAEGGDNTGNEQTGIKA